MANAADTAANFGYSVAFFQSDPELKALLNNAVKGNWTPAQFVAKLQATKWFKKNGEAARQVIALKTSDPATYKQRLQTANHTVIKIAGEIGAVMPYGVGTKISENALMFGWDENQIRAALNSYVKANKTGQFRGGAAAIQGQIREVVKAYGYSATESQMGNWVRQITAGSMSIEQVRESMIKTASSKYPALADRLRAGETLDDIAAPYKDSYSKILEVPSTNIQLGDPLIQRALATKDSKGKPSTQTVWQFERDLKSDPRWLKTNNAREQMVGTTRKLLSDMGLAL